MKILQKLWDNPYLPELECTPLLRFYQCHRALGSTPDTDLKDVITFKIRPRNLISWELFDTSSYAPGIAIKFEGVRSPINHWYFKSSIASLCSFVSLTNSKWQRQASSSNGWSTKAFFSKYPGGSWSFHCSSKNLNVESVDKDKACITTK